MNDYVTRRRELRNLLLVATRSWKNRSSLDTLTRDKPKFFCPIKILLRHMLKLRLSTHLKWFTLKKNESIHRLLWGNKGEQIQRTETITDYHDFRESKKALKITWILKHFSYCESKWKSFCTLYLSKVRGILVFICYSAKKT